MKSSTSILPSCMSHFQGQNKASRDCLMIGDIDTLIKGRLHEATGPAAVCMALIAASACIGPVFWVGLAKDTQALRARGIDQYFDSSRLVTVEAANRREILWASEEALRCKGSNLVVTQIDMGPDLFESRRLQIASQAGASLGLALISRRAQSSAAQTRWNCIPDSSGKSNWVWELTKNKSGQRGVWAVNWKSKDTRKNAKLRPFDLRPGSVSPGIAETQSLNISALPAARSLEPA